MMTTKIVIASYEHTEGALLLPAGEIMSCLIQVVREHILKCAGEYSMPGKHFK